MRTLGRLLLLLTILLFVGASVVVGLERWQAWQNREPVRNAGLDERVLFEAIGPTMRFNAATNEGWFALQGFLVAPTQSRRGGLGLTVEITIQGPDEGVLNRERRYVGLRRLDQVQPYGLLDGRESEPVWLLATEWIDLSPWPRASAVAVRLLERDPEVRAVLWRGAIDSRLTDAQTKLRYRRLGGAVREELTADWITPPSLIAPEVKQELLRYRLERLGPLGQPQRDFFARSVLRKPAPARVRVYQSRNAAIALSPSMRVSFELGAPTRVGIDARTAAGAPMRVDLIAGAVRPVRVIEGRWEGDLLAGLYELHGSAAGTVDVRHSGSSDPLVPNGLRPRFHVAGPSGALRYRLYPVAGRVPALRLSLRAQFTSSVATLAFTDAQGAALASRSVAVPWIASAYDRPSDALDRPVAEAIRVNLQPPQGARELRVSANAALLVTTSTTLPAAPGLQVDPDRRWFTFFPSIDPRSPLSQGVVIVQQPRPKGTASQTFAATRAGNVISAAPIRRAVSGRPVLRLRPERGELERDE